MLTEASTQALGKLRDPSMLEWYVVPLIAGAIWGIAAVSIGVFGGWLGWI